MCSSCSVGDPTGEPLNYQEACCRLLFHMCHAADLHHTCHIAAYTVVKQYILGIGTFALLTLKQLIRQPIPKLSRQETDHASNTKTCARRPKTFAQVLVWDSFCHDAISRFEALDDTAQKYLPQVRYFCRHYLHTGVLV